MRDFSECVIVIVIMGCRHTRLPFRCIDDIFVCLSDKLVARQNACTLNNWVERRDAEKGAVHGGLQNLGCCVEPSSKTSAQTRVKCPKLRMRMVRFSSVQCVSLSQ